MGKLDSEEKESQEPRNRASVEALQRGFAALTKRLTPDIEPPLVFYTQQEMLTAAWFES